jgi:small-conductance mechanosensitive channel
MPTIELSEYYIELIGFLFSLLIGLSIKDLATSFVKGLMFRFGNLKEGDRIIVNNEEGMLIKIGLQQTIIALYTDKGLVWRYVPNTRIPMLNLSKVVDSELHPDSKFEKATKIKKLLKETED